MHVQGTLGKQTQTSPSWIRRKEMMKVSESDSSSSDDVEIQVNKGGRTQARIRQRAPPRRQREPAEKLVSGLIRNAAVGTRGQRISSTQAGAETSQLPDPVGSPSHTSVVIHAKRNLSRGQVILPSTRSDERVVIATRWSRGQAQLPSR